MTCLDQLFGMEWMLENPLVTITTYIFHSELSGEPKHWEIIMGKAKTNLSLG